MDAQHESANRSGARAETYKHVLFSSVRGPSVVAVAWVIKSGRSLALWERFSLIRNGVGVSILDSRNLQEGQL